jgi:glutamate decarboxylase
MHDKRSVQQLDEDSVLTSTYASREMTRDISKHRFPQQSMAPATVYNLIHDELILDSNSR